MSWYTTGEILIWLLLAAILGFILGWLIRGLRARPAQTAEPVAAAAVVDTSDKDLQTLRDANASLQAELDDCAKAKAGLQADLDACRAAAVSVAAAKAAPAAPAKPATPAKPKVVTPTTKDQAVSLVGEIATRTAGTEAAPKDDLQQIFGVGPVISKMLYKMKITSFRQVARFTPQDIATVEKALEFFPDRIVRDDWMSSARELNIEKYGFDPTKGAGKAK